MANLITEKQKKEVASEYWIRLTAMSFWLISLLGVFLLAYIIPYYLSVSKKDLVVADKFQSVISVENKENVGESVSRIVNRTLDEITVAETYSQRSDQASVGFTKIINSKNNNIQISRLSFSLINKDQAQFLINGVSRNRDGLVSFVEALKSEAGFASVESPISDFAKDTNIPFTVNIKTKI
ncbi:MAG: hypothetical protein WC027_03295 [Candidatus Paceibacterota bacterium]